MSIKISFLFFVSTMLFLLNCAKEPLQSDSGNMFVIYELGGERPAAGVIVKLFALGDTTYKPALVCTTDDKGRYSIRSLSTGKYNLWAEKDSSVLFQGSRTISSNYSTLQDDTLRPSSSLSGVVAVQFPHDPRTITIRVIGSDKVCAITEENGTFLLTGLAAGTWSLLVQSSLAGYMPCLKNVSVSRGARDTIADTVRLYSMDLPFVSGVSVVQDTFAGIVKLSWEKTAYKNCVDYVIFRALCSDVEFPKYPIYSTKDTFLIDSIPKKRALSKRSNAHSIKLHQPDEGYTADSLSDEDTFNAIDSLDTVTQCYRYRVAVRTWNQELGPTKGFTELQCAQKASVITYLMHTIKYPKPKLDNSCLSAQASIHDTIVLTIAAMNLTRTLREIVWFDPVHNDTVSKTFMQNRSTRKLRDTVRYAFDTVDSTISPCLIAIVTDDAGERWRDTVFVNIIEDFPFVEACADTGVFIGTKIHLYGLASDYLSTITGWEWKIGGGAWVKASGPDTMFIAPLTEETIACSLAAVNDDGNRAADEVLVFTTRKVQSIMANVSHTLILKDDGALWASGSNRFGQLGDGSREYRENAVRILENVKTMCAGANHTLILKNDGTLWGCGDDSSGQLGDGLTVPHSYPVQIMSDVKGMAAGSNHSLILKTDNTVWACGENSFGQLGDGSMVNRYFPVQIMNNVKDIAAGQSHSIFLKNDGTVLTCGDNEYGQLGIDSALVKHIIVPQLITNDAQSVFAGFHYTLVLKNDKSLWGCGYNEYGQLGDTTMQDRFSLVRVNADVKSIVAGAGFSMTIKTDGALWVCGWNYYGNWGNGTWEDRYKPSLVATDVKSAAASLYYGLVLKNDGTVWTYGISNNGAERIIPFMEPTNQGTD
jgi:alpha-tubulin suppressor-like RCC1 family protein